MTSKKRKSSDMNGGADDMNNQDDHHDDSAEQQQISKRLKTANASYSIEKDVVFSSLQNQNPVMVSALKCCICWCPTMTNIRMHTTCQKNFCESCFTQFATSVDNHTTNKRKRCPVCAHPSATWKETCFPRNYILQEFVDSLETPCLHPECTWRGTYAELKLNHLGKSIFQCLKLFRCPDCSELHDVAERVAHDSLCACKRVPCANFASGCNVLVRRGQMPQHLSSECTKTTVTCPKPRCVWKGCRELVSRHLADECLSNRCELLKTDNDELRAVITRSDWMVNNVPGRDNLLVSGLEMHCEHSDGAAADGKDTKTNDGEHACKPCRKRVSLIKSLYVTCGDESHQSRTQRQNETFPHEDTTFITLQSVAMSRSRVTQYAPKLCTPSRFTFDTKRNLCIIDVYGSRDRKVQHERFFIPGGRYYNKSPLLPPLPLSSGNSSSSPPVLPGMRFKCSRERCTDGAAGTAGGTIRISFTPPLDGVNMYPSPILKAQRPYKYDTSMDEDDDEEASLMPFIMDVSSDHYFQMVFSTQHLSDSEWVLLNHQFERLMS